MGKRPQNTTGIDGLKPGSASAHGFPASRSADQPGRLGAASQTMSSQLGTGVFTPRTALKLFISYPSDQKDLAERLRLTVDDLLPILDAAVLLGFAHVAAGDVDVTDAGRRFAEADILRSKGIRRVGPYQVTRCMSSTVSACLSTNFGIKGINYSITSACSTSAHCIGAAAQQIAWGMQDVMFAGGGEELSWGMSLLFDGMGAMSSKYNATPEKAARAYDANRDGFVIAGGGGMLVLESLEHAQARGARIHAELLGYGVTSDGVDMVAPSGEGAVRCMRMAMTGVKSPIDYINTHGTSTPLGDVTELESLRSVFADAMPPLSSTKALSGHSLGAASVHEAIYCLLMMKGGFLAGSANIGELDPACASYPILRESRNAELNTVLSNSFGFGGTNGSLVLGRFQA